MLFRSAITHGIFSKNAVELIEQSAIKELVMADTIPLSPEKKARTTKIVELSVADILAETIDAIQNHTSVSKVYDQYESRKLQEN